MFKQKHIVILNALLIAFALSTNAQNLRDYISLNGLWYFSIGDNPDWSRYHYNHFNWEKVNVPSRWEQQGFNGYDGFAWYRREVNIPADAKTKSLWLDLGYIDDVDQVFLNGELINSSGNFPPRFKTAHRAHRLYHLPEHLIRYGESNVIAVRVYDAYYEGGIVSGNIRIRADLNPLFLDMPLQGKWKFKPGDNSHYKKVSFNDSDWDEIIVPRPWEDQGYQGYDGIAWYRLKVSLPQNLHSEQLVLILGKIDDVEEVYVNGINIGQTGEIDPSGYFIYGNAWRAERAYKIPKHLYQETQTLTIAVRVYDHTQSGGIYIGPVGLITQNKFIKYWNNKRGM